MQPRGHETPGRNAILASMTDDEIARTTRENIDAMPYAIGVNNHMGSLATADRRVMTSVIGAMPDGMYFIDSRTGGSSVAATVAREMNVRTATRNVFLDDVATERGVRKQLEELAAAAEKRGVAIAIGHPYPVTVRVFDRGIARVAGTRVSVRSGEQRRELRSACGPTAWSAAAAAAALSRRPQPPIRARTCCYRHTWIRKFPARAAVNACARTLTGGCGLLGGAVAAATALQAVAVTSLADVKSKPIIPRSCCSPSF